MATVVELRVHPRQRRKQIVSRLQRLLDVAPGRLGWVLYNRGAIAEKQGLFRGEADDFITTNITTFEFGRNRNSEPALVLSGRTPL